MHTYNDSVYAKWFSVDEEFEDDDVLNNADERCAQQFVSGEFMVSICTLALASGYPR